MSYRQTQEQIRSELTDEQALLFQPREYKGTSPIQDAIQQSAPGTAISTNASIEEYYNHNRNHKWNIFKLYTGLGAFMYAIHSFLPTTFPSGVIARSTIKVSNLNYVKQRAPIFLLLVGMWYGSNIAVFKKFPDLYDPNEPIQ